MFAFARRHEGRTAVVVIPRLAAKLENPDAWADTRLTLPPPLANDVAALRDAFTGSAINPSVATLHLSEIVRGFPVTVML